MKKNRASRACPTALFIHYNIHKCLSRKLSHNSISITNYFVALYHILEFLSVRDLQLALRMSQIANCTSLRVTLNQKSRRIRKASLRAYISSMFMSYYIKLLMSENLMVSATSEVSVTVKLSLADGGNLCSLKCRCIPS